MANAPYCNVSIATPAGDPKKPGSGIQAIPNGATIQQIIRIINNNFQTLATGNSKEFLPARQVTITRIFDPSDSNVYVDVRQITGMTFVNQNTGQTITWAQ